MASRRNKYWSKKGATRGASAITTAHVEVLRVREDIVGGVVRRGLLLEDLSIGFQAPMYRGPNVYNFRYFTNTRNIRIASGEMEPP